jgi:PhzF family phenazine biosynthesis protein
VTVPLTIVDSFTDRPFAGNPAGVCRLDGPAPDAWMQAVAAEVNLSETAFLVPRADGDVDLRWFTPTVEIDLCGHATLASAHVLGRPTRFHTRSGVLTTTVGADGVITMDFPGHEVTQADPADADAPGWAGALGLDADAVIGIWSSPTWTLIQVRSPTDVTASAPDFAAVADRGGHALLVADTTGDPSSTFDSVCRMFAPAAGIPEDPVTGAAHCVIGPWLAARTGRTDFLGHQASRRGGTVAMRVAADRVFLSGPAVTVFEGSLVPPP